MSTRAWILAVVVAALGAGFAWLWWVAEWVEVEVPMGYSEEAWRNPFLAAQLLLEQNDKGFERRSGLHSLDNLPDADSALLITGGRRTLGDQRVTELLDWVRRGGHLLLLADSFWDEQQEASDDPLLDALNIRLVSADDDAGDADEVQDEVDLVLDEAMFDSWVEAAGAAVCPGDAQLASYQLDSLDSPFEEVSVGPAVGYALFPTDRRLIANGEQSLLTADNETGLQLLQQGLGSGRVSVITDSRQWRNARIQCFDHAHLLLYLVGEAPNLYWLYHVAVPSLPMLIWQQFPATLLLLLVLMLFALWYALIRDGALRPVPDQPRRSLLAHVSGSANFLWRQGEAQALVDAAGLPLLAMIEQASQRRGIPEQTLLQQLSRQAAIAPDDLNVLLDGTPLGCWLDRPVRRTRWREHEFLETLQALQALRKQL